MIEGFGFSAYRSFGSYQEIGACRKINLLIGQNNCGKSNVLRYLAEKYSSIAGATATQRKGPLFSGLDLHQGSIPETLDFSFGLAIGGTTYNRILERIEKDEREQRYKVAHLVKRLFESPMLNPTGQMAWFRYSACRRRSKSA